MNEAQDLKHSTLLYIAAIAAFVGKYANQIVLGVIIVLMVTPISIPHWVIVATYITIVISVICRIVSVLTHRKLYNFNEIKRSRKSIAISNFTILATIVNAIGTSIALYFAKNNPVISLISIAISSSMIIYAYYKYIKVKKQFSEDIAL